MAECNQDLHTSAISDVSKLHGNSESGDHGDPDGDDFSNGSNREMQEINYNDNVTEEHDLAQDHMLTKKINSCENTSSNIDIEGQGQNEIFTSAREYRHTQDNKVKVYENVLNEVMQKLPNIDHDIWCTVHYMEYDKTVEKFYILDREDVIDGSSEKFDGESIGLGVLRNSTRDDRTEHIRQCIGKGVKLRKDEDGSIFATRLGFHDVIVKDHAHPGDNCFSEDVITHNGLLPFNKRIKVFDMEEFKSQMGLQMRLKQYNEQKLQQFSVVGISFIEDHEEFHETPCWLLVVNLIAIRNISDVNIKNQVQQMIAELSIRDEEKVEEDLRQNMAGHRHNGRRWSKMNPRQRLQFKKAPLRKTRLELRSKGEKINKHMIYSWDEENYPGNKKKQLNMEEIEEKREKPISMIGGPRPPSSDMQRPNNNGRDFHFNDRHVRHSWAKLEVYIKEEKREIKEREFKAKQENFS